MIGFWILAVSPESKNWKLEIGGRFLPGIKSLFFGSQSNFQFPTL